MAIVPMAALLTASFFVLYALRKVEEKSLKAFGYVVVGFLWLAVLVVFSGAVYQIAHRSAVMKCPMMQQKMKMDHLSSALHKNNPALIPAPEKLSLSKDLERSACAKCQASNKGVVVKSE